MLPIELGSDSTDSDLNPKKDRQLDLQSAMKIVSEAYSSRRDLLFAAWRLPEVNLTEPAAFDVIAPKNPFFSSLCDTSCAVVQL